MPDREIAERAQRDATTFFSARTVPELNFRLRLPEPNQHSTSDRIPDTRKTTAARTLNTVEEIQEHEN